MNKSMWNNEAVKAYESGQGVVLVEKPYPHYEPAPNENHQQTNEKYIDKRKNKHLTISNQLTV